MLRARSIAWFTLLAAVGCGPSTRMPNLFDPGNAATQQYNAIRHDPYPMNDVGPEIVGGRPREYAQPVPEARRGWYKQQTVAPPR
ncbi:hypothetical protein [Botrimarina mediterranea]|uniref:Membrane or secreted protein n=1 Tax=Botrimarina mediterranea TaxID=2528022 RepID=A0A518KAW2_9BACT|nr:hypothetical protein [Botrimarina mediterranea]QDV74933.1 hypothetical protein Spa11_31420 [Botrimarina mediterranea]QDV79578.1 hypothetical protein K2D_31930 [Planctomycetes bacterium K2D]